MLNLSPTPAAPAAANNIFDITMLDFQQKVLTASLQKPVLAYFTAAWCGPCKQLRPLLEKIVTGYAGKITLARIDIDQSPELAEAMRIQSVPQVFAFIAGQPVDGFMGVVPESQIKQFIDKVLKMTGTAQAEAEIEPTEDLSDPYVRARFALEDGNPVAAAAEYREILKTEASEQRAQAGIKFVESLMSFAKPLQEVSVSADATADILYNHAMSLLANGNLPDGITNLLASTKKDRAWQDETAKGQLLALFDVLGKTDPLVMAARRKLSAVLFS